MTESLLNKILFTFFFFCVINVIRHGWRIVLRLIDSDIPNKYELNKQELIFLGISIAYLATTIFTGIKL
jgi:hypothetical protein